MFSCGRARFQIAVFIGKSHDGIGVGDINVLADWRPADKTRCRTAGANPRRTLCFASGLPSPLESRKTRTRLARAFGDENIAIGSGFEIARVVQTTGKNSVL